MIKKYNVLHMLMNRMVGNKTPLGKCSHGPASLNKALSWGVLVPKVALAVWGAGCVPWHESEVTAS